MQVTLESALGSWNHRTRMGDSMNRTQEYVCVYQSTSASRTARSELLQPGWNSLKAVIKAEACGCFVR